MTSMEMWNIIVDKFQNYRDKDEPMIQILWEDIFSQIFGYSKILGYLDSQKSLPIGSNRKLRPDIILKKGINDICAVELKQEKITLNKNIENQLFSYLKQAKIDTGLVIADKIYIYPYKYSLPDSEQSMVAVDFVHDNPEGELFIKLFNYDSFDNCAISKFVEEKINHLNNVEHIRSNLNKTVVLDALSDYFGSNYSQDEIKEALNSIEIKIFEHKNVNQPISQTKDTDKQKNNDIYDGLVFDKDILINGGNKSSNYVRNILIEKKIISNDCKTTIAKLNKDGKRYWANPNINFLNSNWMLVLNNNVKNRLYFFYIPANSLAFEQVRTRTHCGKTLIDLEITHDLNEFVDIGSKIMYSKWLVKEIKY